MPQLSKAEARRVNRDQARSLERAIFDQPTPGAFTEQTRHEPWHNRIVRFDGAVPVSVLLAHPLNARLHPQAQSALTQQAIDRFGVVKPLLAQDGSNMLIDGHLRLALAKRTDQTAVPVIYLDVDDSEAAGLLAVLDPLSSLATIDAELLAELQDEAGLDPDDDGLGAFVQGLIDDQGEPAHEPEPESAHDTEALNDAPDAPRSPQTKPGDIWLLGDAHRLICGDATNLGHVEAVLNGERPELVVADPPYNVGYIGGNNGPEHARDALANDQMSEEAFGLFLTDALLNCYTVLPPGATAYVFHGIMWSHILRAAYAAAGLDMKQMLIWVKDQAQFSRADYHWRHEAIAYGWKPGAAHYFIDDHTKTTVLEFDRPRRSDAHPTMKPVELLAELVRNSSKPGDLILDPFAGSGSIMAAGEETGRRTAMIEIDPRYCDVICLRYNHLTGELPRLLASGDQFIADGGD